MLGQTSAPQQSGYSEPGLAPGDQVLVRMYDFPEAAAGISLRLEGDGTLILPYAGKIHAAGLTPGALQQAIVAALRDQGIVKQPNVTVDVTASMALNVLVQGQVVNPRSVAITAPAPLSYVLSQVGGLTGLASHKLTIVHRGDEMPTLVDYDTRSPNSAAMNTLIVPGDIINVTYEGVYFVGGEVNHPGIFPIGGALSAGQSSALLGYGLVDHVTLLEALAQAGGITAIAKRSRLHILRTENGKRVDINVDQVKLSNGEVADPVLQPNDIVYIPPSYLRQQTNNLFSTALSSLYAVTQIKTANF
ncbi:polysaccharide biosynthesis/export family protein [Acidicapsa dinghuensis]|uniref:Polysaccharide biosynthesis/export family protein n=1 Tax=Acidicapsa dinghuensis TaxID=2218256 RepID=A0ABW1EAV7_9BACT|nr:polysaccharide biosynthesis/export family protein [Acidicapsa dinghuensis]